MDNYKDSDTYEQSMKKAGEIVDSMFNFKSSMYTQGFRRLAALEAILFKGKDVNSNPLSSVRAFFVHMILVKLVRFCDHILEPAGHQDSTIDMAVYAKMLLALELDNEGNHEIK